MQAKGNNPAWIHCTTVVTFHKALVKNRRKKHRTKNGPQSDKNKSCTQFPLLGKTNACKLCALCVFDVFALSSWPAHGFPLHWCRKLRIVLSERPVRVAELAQVVLWQARGMRSTAQWKLACPSKSTTTQIKMHYFQRDGTQRET